MKKSGLVFLIFFIILVFLPVPVFTLFREQIGYKNTENKAENPFPELNRENFSTWPKRFEEWFSDNLPFKTQFIELFRGFQLRSGLDFTQSDVIRGKENFLFYRTTVENYKGISRFTGEELEQIRDNLESFFGQMEADGIKCQLFIAPDKEQVYPGLMPDRIRRVSEKSRGDQLAEYLSANTEIQVFYPKVRLQELSRSLPVYYSTDTHWNDLGGWAAADLVSSARKGEETSSVLPQFHYYENEGKDLAGMLGLSEQIPEENAVLIDYDDDLTIWKPESIEHGMIQRFSSYSDNKQKMLLVGDSFAEYFMRSAIHDISEILFVTYGQLYRVDIEAEKPDTIVVMLVERNLPFLINGFY